MSLKQVAIIGGGISAVSGGVAGVYLLTPSTTIKDHLTSKDIKLISINAAEKIWKTAWNEINSDNTLKAIESTVNSHTTLKTFCEGNYEKSSSEKAILEKVEKLCIQPPKNIGEKLKRKGISFTNDWGAKLTALKEGDSKNTLLNKLKITTEGLENLDTPETANAALEKWCESRKSVELPESGGVGDYDEVIKHCIK